MRCKIEEKCTQKKKSHKIIFTKFGNLPTSTALQECYYSLWTKPKKKFH